MINIEVIVPLALPMPTLTYTCQRQVRVGARVLVDVRSTKQVIGVVRAVGVESPLRGELKSVIEVIDYVPLIGERELRFIDWVSDYYFASKGETLRALMPHLFSAESLNLSCRYLKPKRIKIDALRQLVNLNVQARQSDKITPPQSQFSITESVTLLHAKSKIDLAALVGSLIGEDGVVLILVPTSDLAQRVNRELEQYFRTAVCTQQRSTKKRAALAVDLACGLDAQFVPQVVVGTRAALGLGYRALLAIVVTDEESFRYKSQRVPQLSVRDSALMLAALHGAKSVLISEFPTVESYYNASCGTWRYMASDLPAAPLKYIVLEHGKELLSKYLRNRIGETLQANKRVVLMQNRRGMASYIECVACGDIPSCKNCSTSYTVHRHLLGCHYCGSSVMVTTCCEKCGGAMELRGRGTQRIEELMCGLYPEAKIVRVDSDAIADDGYVIDPDWQIVIGTKMVIESIDWQGVGLASVLNVDNMISTPDFRATEDTFRTVGTMAARCRDVGAELVVQSSMLKNEDVDDALNFRYDPFYIRAIDDRRAALFPPHSRMIKLTFRGESMQAVVATAKEAEAALRPIFAHRLSPMHQPPVERQAGDHIVEILLKIERGRSSAKAKELLHHHLTPIIRRARGSKVAISAQSDPL